MNPDQNIIQRLAAQNNQNKFSFTTESIEIEEEEVEPTGNIIQRLAAKEEKRQKNVFGFLGTAKDVAEQVVTKGISGAGGALGTLLDTFGLQPGEGQQLPGQEIVSGIKSDLREKMSSGEALSFQDLMLLAESEDEPALTRLPTTEEGKRQIEGITGIGEGKTTAGRIAGRGAEFVGEGLALPGGGVKTLATLGTAGLVGQSLREAGAPEGLATGAEIAGSLLPSVVQGKVRPISAERAKVAEAGRSIGLTEKQITPLVQSEKRVATLSKFATKGEKTKNRFESIKQSLGDSYDEIKSRPEAKGKFSKTEKNNIVNEFSAIKSDLLNTLEPSPEKKDAIKFIDNSIRSLKNKTVTPETLINFWQDINKAVPWGKIGGGKKSLARLKTPILEVFENVSPQLAKDFENTNLLFSKYANISKKLKPDVIDALLVKGEILAAPGAAIALVKGNPSMLAGIATESAVGILSREMLISPFFQDIGKKLVTNLNSGSARAVESGVKQVQEFLDRKHPNEDWSFLTQD